MTEHQFWRYLEKYAEFRNLWWYDLAVLPAIVISICTFCFMIFALRRERSILLIFLWLCWSGIPIVLIVPSFYTSLNLQGALATIGFQMPEGEHQINQITAYEISKILDQLVSMGLVGTALILMIMFSIILINNNSQKLFTQFIQTRARTITMEVTKLITIVQRADIALRPLNARYGTLTVERSRMPSLIRAVRSDMIIGRVGADLTLIDEIVSRRHAKLTVKDNRVYIEDLNSSNGTFVKRDKVYDLHCESDPFEIHHGDRIYLGRIDDPQSVVLLYERQNE